jgi:hypothetical protein
MNGERTGVGHTVEEARIVTLQLGREPREPWRVSSSCRWGYPTTIASPSTLADGTPFPNLVWLTCPYLAERISALESAGRIAEFARYVAEDESLADALRDTDERFRRARKVESGGTDACEAVGIAGQSDPLGVKCLHAHAALALVHLNDPIGVEVLEWVGYQCSTRRCEKFGTTPEGPDE